MRFCEKLRNLRIDAGFGFNEFWKEADITNVYLSGLENGTKTPPPPERQRQFIKILEKKKRLSLEEKNQFYDLAAKERKELPADIVEYCQKQESLNKIRKLIKENSNEKI